MGTNETKHLMALNPFRSSNKGHISSLPLAEYDKLISYPWLHEAILQIRGEHQVVGKDMTAAKLKSQLPFRCAHYFRFQGDKRRQDHIDQESFLFQTSVDIDEAELVETALEMAKLLDESETLGTKNGETIPNPWKGMLLHLEYSARKKLHIDIRMPIGMTIEETQRAYCDALGVPCDESCFSPERIIFITDKESEIYRSPMWYAVLSDEELRIRREAFAKRGLDIDGRKNQSNSNQSVPNQSNQISIQANANNNPSAAAPSQNDATEQSTVGGNQVPPHSLSHPADSDSATGDSSAAPHSDGGNPGTDKSLVAFDLFRKQANLDKIDINQEGSRHSSLLAILSAGASRVMSEDDMRRVVAIRMPEFSGERDCQQLIHDFYAKYGDSSKPFSRDVIRINAEAEKLVKSEERRVKNSMALMGNEGTSSNEADDFPPPPSMPQKLPKLVELLLSRTPDIYKPAVACAIFPPLATHLWKTTFRYIDNVDHEATLMCALLAGTGAGKNCVQMPINLIMEDIRKRDAENLKREKAWKDEVTRKGANKDKRKRPENLIIQEIDADMTNPAFVMRTAEAQEHFLYTSLNEIDQFDALKGEGKQQFRIMCLAFDPGNQYGQTRVGTQSVTERVCVRFNWNASTTIHKGQQYFAKVLTAGPISRINFCTIPEREIGADMPIYGTYDDAFREQLRPYIENLCRITGHIDSAEAYQLAIKLKDENADFARMTQSRIYENLSFRANVIAYLKACVLYVANGCQWEPEIEDFIRWSEQYDLWCKLRFFGDAIVKSEVEGVKSTRRGPRNMLQQLPDIFTFHEVEQLRWENGLSKEGTNIMLNTWVHRHYIRRGSDSNDNYSNDSFEKLKFRRDGVEINDK
ncbi:MAG TPA: hypothetical protein PLP97_10195 [Prevotella sp.]|nr:hypothetical protein [Prevotella sp.]